VDATALKVMPLVAKIKTKFLKAPATTGAFLLVAVSRMSLMDHQGTSRHVLVFLSVTAEALESAAGGARRPVGTASFKVMMAQGAKRWLTMPT
jgi:hypothetical protein